MIAYTAYNEGWGERALADTQRVGQNIKNLDPTRLVNVHSRATTAASPSATRATATSIDWHIYAGPGLTGRRSAPGSPRSASSAALGLRTPGHE